MPVETVTLHPMKEHPTGSPSFDINKNCDLRKSLLPWATDSWPGKWGWTALCVAANNKCHSFLSLYGSAYIPLILQEYVQNSFLPLSWVIMNSVQALLSLRPGKQVHPSPSPTYPHPDFNTVFEPRATNGPCGVKIRACLLKNWTYKPRHWPGWRKQLKWMLVSKHQSISSKKIILETKQRIVRLHIVKGVLVLGYS